MKILVLNSGSSSLKYQLFELPSKKVLAIGLVEKIGEVRSKLLHQINETKERETHKILLEESIPNHEMALQKITQLLLNGKDALISNESELKAIGHRVVHGGEKFSAPIVVTPEILNKLHRLSYLAPLHNPANIKGIEIAASIFKQAKQIAVFDTAFHQTLPDYAYRYAVPNSLYKEQGIRVYGFHGTSHQYVLREAAAFLGQDLDSFNAITIHLGNGCSMAAIQNEKCIDTSMGMTPMGGLMMGTRPGDFDPSLIPFLCNQMGKSLKEIDDILNKQSGLKGITNDNDMREIIEHYNQGNTQAILAINMYVYRIKKYIGAYAVALGRIDAIVFTAGVGENSSFIRKKVCENMAILGIQLDKHLNEQKSRAARNISQPSSQIKLLVIPTNEELEIVNEAEKLI